jgi:phage regulator Rha-like protein
MIEKIKTLETVKDLIFNIRGVFVMFDRDLAEIYQVENKRLNEQVKRNIKRFPVEFRFQLNNFEKSELVANCDRFKNLKHSSVNPYAFTEQGVAMLSSVLRSETAIKVSIKIINAFVEMRHIMSNNAELFQRLNKVEQKQIESDDKFDILFNALESKKFHSNQGIFYDGQVFDAWLFVSDLIKTAKNSILLIDNYVDESVLQLLTKRRKNVNVVIYTKNINRILMLDLKKHNKQYPQIEIKEFTKAHDRFLIIDQKSVYHFGASLKDLGKKWFAFSRMDSDSLKILDLLKEEFI